MTMIPMISIVNDSTILNSRCFPAKGAFAFQQQVGCQADEHRQQRADRRGKAHGQQVVREQLGHEIGPRHTHQHDGQNVMQERKLAAAVSAEIPAEAEVDTRKEAVPDIPAQVPAARATAASLVNRATALGAINCTSTPTIAPKVSEMPMA